MIVDGVDQGPSKDEKGKALPIQCNEGKHTISLTCCDGKTCTPTEVCIEVKGTNPAHPLEVIFKCE